MIKYLFKFLFFFMGCFATYFFHRETSVSPVIASASIGLLGSFIPLGNSKNKSSYYASLYSGSFAGMCSTDVVTNFQDVAIISLIGSVLYISTINIFKGVGGKLGTVALLSVCLFYLGRTWL